MASSWSVWTEEEEDRLCLAWLLHTDFNYVGYWYYIHDAYKKMIPDGYSREEFELKRHWIKYNKQVRQFEEIFMQSRRTLGDGATEAEVLIHARENYQSKFRVAFMKHEWWVAVKDSEKWRRYYEF